MFDFIRACNFSNAELIGLACIIVLAALIPWWISGTVAVALAGFAGWRIRAARKPKP